LERVVEPDAVADQAFAVIDQQPPSVTSDAGEKVPMLGMMLPPSWGWGACRRV
jgi:hypothetical protein